MLKVYVLFYKGVKVCIVMAIFFAAFILVSPLTHAQNATLEVSTTTGAAIPGEPAQETNDLPKQIPAVQDESSPQNSGIDLAIKSFLLSQGEDGSTLWRLKAISGTMHKESDLILIDQPALVYYLPPDNDELFVSSDRGEVVQAAKRIRFLGNVVLRHGGSTITSDELVYDGNTKTMEIPHGGFLLGERNSGRADRIVWHLDTRILRCEGSVETTFLSHGAALVPFSGTTNKEKD